MIELVIVMAMLGLLLSIALPQYMATLERGRAQVQEQSLLTMREAIDKFYGDRGRYPDKLEDLVTLRYLRAIPNDPFTDAPTWLVVAPKDSALGGVIDVQAAPNESRRALTAPPAEAGSDSIAPIDLPPSAAPAGMVAQEGGSTRVVTMGLPASAPGTDEVAR